MTLRRFFRLFAVVMVVSLVSSCSTTKRLGPDDVLYTGVKKLEIVGADNEKVPGSVKTKVETAVDVAPNNYIKALKWRYPFPLGLWVYNNWPNPEKGFKHWIYEKLAEDPVLISEVRPQLRTKMIEDELDNSGYFRNTASYELIYNKKNPKKAKISYRIETGPAYLLDSIEFLPDTCHLYHKIDSLAHASTYLKPGNRYSTDSLSVARTKITNSLRNLGYYFFRPEYIEYLADSTITPERIALRMTIARNTPKFAQRRFRTGDITVYINRNQGGGTPDTTVTRRGTIIRMMPSKLRTGLIPGCVTFREGKTFSVRDMNRTQTYLSRLGIFNYINIEAIPDTTSSTPTLDVAIECTFDAPYEASIEANVSSKSNSYIGPGVTVSVTNRNLFGGGEQLRVGLTGAYEWQTGHGSAGSVFNSYEIGINSSLAFPRLLLPRFIGLSRRNLNWTRFTLNADLLNRPHYFNMAQFSASMNYDWQMRKYFTYTFTPLKLTFIKMIRTTELFDSIIGANPAVGLSFRNQFIPQIGWSMIYDRAMNRDNTINVQASVAEAGNLMWTLWRACGVRGEKRLFGMPFSQFVKGTAQLVYSRRLHGDSWLVTRVFGGIAHAYGNSAEVPYSEQFYVGGANSVRAFAVRSIGPGSYHPAGDRDNNFDETGTFKFEFNVEYRFPIVGPLHGAIFLDSGNVWLLKNDPERPGSKLEGRTFFKDLAVGTGVGLRFDISMLVLRADLGVGIHAPYDTGKSGYYNMRSFKDSLAFHLAIGYPF